MKPLQLQPTLALSLSLSRLSVHQIVPDPISIRSPAIVSLCFHAHTQTVSACNSYSRLAFAFASSCLRSGVLSFAEIAESLNISFFVCLIAV